MEDLTTQGVKRQNMRESNGTDNTKMHARHRNLTKSNLQWKQSFWKKSSKDSPLNRMMEKLHNRFLLLFKLESNLRTFHNICHSQKFHGITPHFLIIHNIFNIDFYIH